MKLKILKNFIFTVLAACVYSQAAFAINFSGDGFDKGKARATEIAVDCSTWSKNLSCSQNNQQAVDNILDQLSTSGGANPAGSGTEIQSRLDATTFGAVTGSSVSGGQVTLVDKLTLTKTDNRANINDILLLQNTTSATALLPTQYSPAEHFIAKAWDTSSLSSKTMDCRNVLETTSGHPTQSDLFTECQTPSSGGYISMVDYRIVDGVQATVRISQNIIAGDIQTDRLDGPDGNPALDPLGGGDILFQNNLYDSDEFLFLSPNSRYLLGFDGTTVALDFGMTGFNSNAGLSFNGLDASFGGALTVTGTLMPASILTSGSIVSGGTTVTGAISATTSVTAQTNFLGGGFAMTTTDQGTDYTVLSNDSLVTMNASTGNRIITLILTGVVPGKIYYIVKTDSTANTVTINRAGSQTINGTTSYVLSLQNQYLAIVANGTNWQVVGSGLANPVLTVSNTDGTLTISPTTGVVVASLAKFYKAMGVTTLLTNYGGL